MPPQSTPPGSARPLLPERTCTEGGAGGQEPGEQRKRGAKKVRAARSPPLRAASVGHIAPRGSLGSPPRTPPPRPSSSLQPPRPGLPFNARSRRQLCPLSPHPPRKRAHAHPSPRPSLGGRANWLPGARAVLGEGAWRERARRRRRQGRARAATAASLLFGRRGQERRRSRLCGQRPPFGSERGKRAERRKGAQRAGGRQRGAGS